LRTGLSETFPFHAARRYRAGVTLEELGIKYDVREISLSKNEQRKDWYLRINPIGRIPAAGTSLSL